jgi:hypothetical protein
LTQGCVATSVLPTRSRPLTTLEPSFLMTTRSSVVPFGFKKDIEICSGVYVLIDRGPPSVLNFSVFLLIDPLMMNSMFSAMKNKTNM